MTILSKKNKRSTTINSHLGVSVPKYINDYLSLFALSRSMPKSMIVVDELYRWREDKLRSHPAEELAKEIANRVFEEWKSIQYSSITKETFLQRLTLELVGKVSNEHKTLIYDEVKKLIDGRKNKKKTKTT